MHNLVDWVTHMNWVDFVFLVVIVYSVVTGAWLGFMAECVSLAGVAAGTLIAGLTYHNAGTLLGDLRVPKDARDWAGFVAVFVVVSLIFRIGAFSARNLSRLMIRGWSNNVAGALIGVLVGSIICLFVLVTVAYFQLGHLVDPLHHSKIAASSTSWLKEYVGLLPTKMHVIPGYLP
ncbi:MAG TPA: CvpA family protein [Chloroflexota bacterium]|nr:CvpA family protein [Chloroflexota bacterium]